MTRREIGDGDGIAGSALDGINGAKNRTYTLPYDDAISTGMMIIVNQVYLHRGTGKDYTFSTTTNAITFLNEMFDDQIIDGFYYTGAATDEDYCTVAQLRQFLQFSDSNNPNDTDMTFAITQSKTEIDNDLGGSETDAQKTLYHLHLSSSYVFRMLARRALRYGYIEMQVEGGTVRKSHKELIEQADSDFNKYTSLINKDVSDVSITSPLRDLDVDTQEDLVNILHGTSDGEDYEDNLSNSYARRRRST